MHILRFNRWKWLGVCLFSTFSAVSVAKSDLCQKDTIELVVPWPAGGGTDAHARLLAEPLSKIISKNIVVLNRPGAGGVVGTNHFVNNAKPDGCSLIMMTGATNTAAPYIYDDIKFEPLDDFTPISFVAVAPNVLFVPKNSPYQTVDDVITDAKERPGEITYASGGVGASSHLAGALFATLAELNLVHVPYQGAGPAMAGLMGGQVDISLDTSAQSNHVHGGNLRALAIAADQRITALPDVPTFSEEGLENFHYSFWSGIAGPKGLPDSMVVKLNSSINEALSMDETKERFQKDGNELRLNMTSAEFKKFWQSELKRNKEIVELAGAEVD